MNISIADNWYESFFTGINCEMWEKAATQPWTDAEVLFIEDVMNVPKQSHLLDIPCGNGRHSIELSRHGFNVTAVDISATFLDELKNKVEEQRLSIELIHGNILTMNLKGSFDGAFCLGNSFGYFDFAGMESFAAKVSASLKGDAKWIINTGLIAESFLAKFVKEKTYELDGMTMQINNDYDEWNSCLHTTLTYTKSNAQEIHRFKHHVYTIAELIRLLKKYHFQTIALYSSTDKAAFKLGDAQLYLVSQKEK
jgi:cyclopropane fatty-acyl-phospholipid synthase-like methyltransferase